MGPLLAPLRQMAHQTNTAIVLIHHMSRQGHARGSTAIKAAVDQEMAFHRIGPDDGNLEDQVRGTIRVEGRFGPPVAINVRLGDALRWELSDLGFIIGESGGTRGRVLSLLRNTGEWMDVDAIIAETSTSKKTVQNSIALMLNERPQLIIARGTGRKSDPRQFHAVEPVLMRDETVGIIPDSRSA
jgi:hypothetical protein